mgnify:CR=1 FL=1
MDKPTLQQILDLQRQSSPSWPKLLNTMENLRQSLPPNWNEALKAVSEMQRNLRILNSEMMATAMDVQKKLPLESRISPEVLEQAQSAMSFASRMTDMRKRLMPLIELYPQLPRLQKAVREAAFQAPPAFPEGVPVGVFDEPLSDKMRETWDEALEAVDAAVEKTLEHNIEIQELPSEETIQTLVFVVFLPLFFCATPSGIDEWLEKLLRATIEFFKSLGADPTPEKVVVAYGLWTFLKAVVSNLSKKGKDKPRSSGLPK